jgi:hypothetical protein
VAESMMTETVPAVLFSVKTKLERDVGSYLSTGRFTRGRILRYLDGDDETVAWSDIPFASGRPRASEFSVSYH